jgi:hypothetical protein
MVENNPNLSIIQKKNLISIQDTPYYLNQLQSYLKSFEESIGLKKGQKFSEVIPFLAFSEQGGMFKSVTIDSDIGFPDYSEVLKIIKNIQPEKLYYMSSKDQIESKKRELQLDAHKALKKGNNPEQFQEFYRLIDTYDKIKLARENGLMPKIKEINYIFKVNKIKINIVDYSILQNHPIYWEITLINNPLSRLVKKSKFSWFNSKKDTQIIESDLYPFQMNTSNLGYEPTFDFERILLGNIYFDPLVVKLAIEKKYGNIVESIKTTSVGPFYFPGVTNYDFFKSRSINMCDEDLIKKTYGNNSNDDIKSKYGSDISFLVIREKTIDNQGINHKIDFICQNDFLKTYLYTLNFPDFYYLKIPTFSVQNK